MSTYVIWNDGALRLIAGTKSYDSKERAIKVAREMAKANPQTMLLVCRSEFHCCTFLQENYQEGNDE